MRRHVASPAKCPSDVMSQVLSPSSGGRTDRRGNHSQLEYRSIMNLVRCPKHCGDKKPRVSSPVVAVSAGAYLIHGCEVDHGG